MTALGGLNEAPQGQRSSLGIHLTKLCMPADYIF